MYCVSTSFENDISNVSFGPKNWKFYSLEHEPQSKNNLLKGRKLVRINRRKRYGSTLLNSSADNAFRIFTYGRTWRKHRMGRPD
jgi:hypothetical protein